MASQFQFSLVSPERELFSGPVDQVIVPGEEGQLGVLANHAPFMAVLKPGTLLVIEGANTHKVFVNGGFADITPSGLTVLAEDVVRLEQVDRAQLDADLARARADLEVAGEDLREKARAHLSRLEAIAQALAA